MLIQFKNKHHNEELGNDDDSSRNHSQALVVSVLIILRCILKTIERSCSGDFQDRQGGIWIILFFFRFGPAVLQNILPFCINLIATVILENALLLQIL